MTSKAASPEQVQAVVQAVLSLRAYDPADPMILHSGGKCNVELTGCLSGRPLGFWTMATPSAAENYTAFEKQILVQYWTLGETECLTTGTKEPCFLVPVMSWVMPGPPSNEVR